MRRSFARILLAVVLGAPSAGAFVWPSTVERTAVDLTSPDVAVRRRAALELGSLPDPSVRRIGLAALSDSDVDVRVAALGALLDARAPDLGRRVTLWLGDPDVRIRRAAADALARDPSREAVPALGRVLGDPDPTIRSAAAKALGAAGTSNAVVPLLGRLDDTEPDVREAVAAALARLGDRSAVVPLIGKIQDGRPSVRRSVASALGALGDPRASGALALSLRDPDESVRSSALGALGRIHAEDTITTIVSLLADERRPTVRDAAFDALGDIPSDAGIAALVNALSLEDARERSPAETALVRIGAPALPRLTACLEGQPDAQKAAGCALALSEIGKSGAVDTVVSALRRGVVRPTAALRALGRCDDPRAVGAVLEYLGSDDPWVRRAAVDAATSLLKPDAPDGRPVEAIERAIDAAHGRAGEQIGLLTLLGRTGSPRAAPFLAAAARDSRDVTLRLAAIRALGNVGRANQDAVLLDALSDERSDVRVAAALSLRRTGSAASAAVLLRRFAQAAEQDRVAVGMALPGVFANVQDPAIVSSVEDLARSNTGPERDVLIEALGAVRGLLGTRALERLLGRGAPAPARAKIAEVLGDHPEGVATLEALARDADPSVRANAVWSLGALAKAKDETLFESLLEDVDVNVSGNAAAALGKLGARVGSVPKVLCGALSDARPYVRANALAGLAASHVRCAGGVEQALLERDPVDFVRAAAAALIFRVPSEDASRDRAALSRCIADEPSVEVARACASPGENPTSASGPVTVYVVPSGATTAASRVPFALFLADGFVRLGITDESGTAYEVDAPSGPLKLGIPAPLAE